MPPAPCPESPSAAWPACARAGDGRGVRGRRVHGEGLMTCHLLTLWPGQLPRPCPPPHLALHHQRAVQPRPPRGVLADGPAPWAAWRGVMAGRAAGLQARGRRWRTTNGACGAGLPCMACSCRSAPGQLKVEAVVASLAGRPAGTAVGGAWHVGRGMAQPAALQRQRNKHAAPRDSCRVAWRRPAAWPAGRQQRPGSCGSAPAVGPNDAADAGLLEGLALLHNPLHILHKRHGVGLGAAGA